MKKPSKWKFIDTLERFGVDNHEPIFLLKNVLPNDLQRVGKENNHIKINIDRNGGKINAIGFNLAEKLSKPKLIDIIFTLKTNIWRERTNYQLNLIDIKESKE